MGSRNGSIFYVICSVWSGSNFCQYLLIVSNNLIKKNNGTLNSASSKLFFKPLGIHLRLLTRTLKNPPLADCQPEVLLIWIVPICNIEKMYDRFYRVDLTRSTWEVPERYEGLQAIGSGAYGNVW